MKENKYRVNFHFGENDYVSLEVKATNKELALAFILTGEGNTRSFEYDGKYYRVVLDKVKYYTVIELSDPETNGSVFF